MFFLLPYLGVYGWKKGKAPFNKFAPLTIITSVILLVSALIVYLLLMIQVADPTLSFAEAAASAAGDIAFAAIATFVGIFLNYRTLFATNEKRRKDLLKNRISEERLLKTKMRESF